VRKILGASKTSIVLLLSGEFTVTVLIAMVVALPVSWYATSQWLQGFQFRIELQWWFFAGSGLVCAADCLVHGWISDIESSQCESYGVFEE